MGECGQTEERLPLVVELTRSRAVVSYRIASSPWHGPWFHNYLLPLLTARSLIHSANYVSSGSLAQVSE